MRCMVVPTTMNQRDTVDEKFIHSHVYIIQIASPSCEGWRLCDSDAIPDLIFCLDKAGVFGRFLLLPGLSAQTH